MEVIYISETQENCAIIKKIITKIKNVFNSVNKEIYDEKVIYLLPTNLNKQIRIGRFIKKIIKDLRKKEIKGVILSEKLKNINGIEKYFIENNINVFDGKYLFKCLAYEATEYILKKQEKKTEESEVSILINEFNSFNIEIIKQFARNVKILNIITRNIDKSRSIEENLYNEFGILINISNNKKRSLLESKIILNFEFTEKEINQYYINNEAIIINFSNKIIVKTKRFNGVNINKFKIDIPNKYKIDGFANEDIYEGIIYKKDFDKIKQKILDDKIRIIKLIGNNINIRDSEYIERK